MSSRTNQSKHFSQNSVFDSYRLSFRILGTAYVSAVFGNGSFVENSASPLCSCAQKFLLFFIVSRESGRPRRCSAARLSVPVKCAVGTEIEGTSEEAFGGGGKRCKGCGKCSFQ